MKIILYILCFFVGFILARILNNGFSVGGIDCMPGQMCPGEINCPNCEKPPCSCPSGPTPTPSNCTYILNTLCNGARNESVGECMVCAGIHQSDLMKAKCTENQINTWCDNSAPPAGDYFGLCIDDTSINSKSFRNFYDKYNMFRLYRWDLPNVKMVADELVNQNKKIMIGISVKGRTNNNVVSDVNDIVNKIHDSNLSQQYKDNLISVSIGNEYGMNELSLVQFGIGLVKNRIKPLIPNLKITSCLLFNADTIRTPFTTPIASWPTLKYGPILNAIKDDIDVVSVNVYTLDGSQPGSSGDITGISFNERDSFFYNMISQIRNVIGNEKEFWVTETGWPYKFTGYDPIKIRNPKNQNKFIKNIKENLNKGKMITQNGYLYNPKIKYKVPDKVFLFCADCNYSNGIHEYFGLNNCN